MPDCSGMALWRFSASAGGMFPMGSRSRRLLNQSTHSRVASSTATNERHGPAPMNDLGFVKIVDGLGQSIDHGLNRRSSSAWAK